MFDISKLTVEEILDYQYGYLVRHCIDDIQEFFDDLTTEEKGFLACELYQLVLEYNPSY